MKKTLNILLALFMLALVGCAQNNTKSNNNEPITYQIYCSSPQSVITNESETNSETTKTAFHSASDLQLYLSDSQKYTNPNASQFKEFSIGNETFRAELSNSFSPKTQSKFQEFESYDNYVNTEGERISFSFRKDTDELVFFLAYDRNNESKSGISQQEAKEIATELFVKLYGNEMLAEYNHIIDAMNSSKTYYSFYFCKAINGIRTQDRVMISINFQGQLLSLNAKTLGILDEIKSDITEKHLSDAETALRSSISKSYEIKDRELFVDFNTGKCYLQVLAGFTKDNAFSSDYFYINVN